MEIVQADTDGIARAAEALLDGEVVAYPTESVYGLGVDPFNVNALEKLYAVKGRDTSNPVLVIVSDMTQLERLVDSVSDSARGYAERFWPGPLSMLFPALKDLPELLVGPHDRICARMTTHLVASALCAAFDGAITSTSANRSSEAPAQSASEVLLEGVAVCIDGGIADGMPSTILDPESGTVLREGAVSRAELLGDAG